MFLLTLVFTLGTQSAEIPNIDPYQLIKYVKKNSQKKPLVVHFSSSDKQCGKCLESNKRIRQAHKLLNEEFDFIELDFNPWRSYWKKKNLLKTYRKKKIVVSGLPATRIFYKEHVISGIDGNVSTLINDISESQGLINIFDNPDSVKGKSIPIINSENLSEYIKNNNKKPLLVHFTSTDDSSPHCKRNNAYMRKTYNNLQASFNFVEVIFNPWNDIKKEKKLRKKYKIKGLPHLVIYRNNKPVSYQGGVTPSLEKGLLKYAESFNK